MGKRLELIHQGESLWEIPAHSIKGQNVPARIYSSKEMISRIDTAAFDQLVRAATLPGVIQHTIGLPDIHSGYGLPIGGVMATDFNNGVVSPGASGYDINCGVRLMATPFVKEQIVPLRVMLADLMKGRIPSGMGRGGKVELTDEDYRNIAEHGSAWAINHGFGIKSDLGHTESYGRLDGGSLETVSSQAIKRGRNEAGTIGSGNHFCEIQYIDTIYSPEIAKEWSIDLNMVTVMIHTGSRGFGHQIATDYLRVMEHAMKKYGITVPDRELACAPIDSKEGQNYLAAMRAAANYAWVNRQILMHFVRELFAEAMGADMDQMPLIYDVAHNIIKLEEHAVEGKKRKVMVHRKGATRALAPGHPDLPEAYQKTGQPVLVPGDMGRMSYLLAGTEGAMRETFGSACHGAGRAMSRHQALKNANSNDVRDKLAQQGIEVRSANHKTLAEEMPLAYKDVSQVVDVVTKAGLAMPVARLRPIAVIKG